MDDPISLIIEAMDQRRYPFSIDIGSDLDVGMFRTINKGIITMVEYTPGESCYQLPLSPVSPNDSDFYKWIKNWWVDDIPEEFENAYSEEHDDVSELIDSMDTCWLGVKITHRRGIRSAMLLDTILAYGQKDLLMHIHQASAKFAGHYLIEVNADSLSKKLYSKARSRKMECIADFYSYLNSWARIERVRLSSAIDEYNKLYVEAGLMESPIRHRLLANRLRK